MRFTPSRLKDHLDTTASVGEIAEAPTGPGLYGVTLTNATGQQGA
ncbi:hypothetical protein [Aliiroseovarius sp.]|nr:hypothetical protein [Aliiroseovarius sp.]